MRVYFEQEVLHRLDRPLLLTLKVVDTEKVTGYAIDWSMSWYVQWIVKLREMRLDVKFPEN